MDSEYIQLKGKERVLQIVQYLRDEMERGLQYRNRPRGGQQTNGGPPPFHSLLPSDHIYIEWWLREIEDAYK